MENVIEERIEVLEEEVKQLRDELEAERVKSARLESELDDLAFDNERMRGLLTAAGIEKLRVDSAHADVVIETATGPSETDGFELLEEGDLTFPQNPSTKIENACGGMNVISALFLHASLPFHSTQGELMVCGGVDKILRIYDVTCHEHGHGGGNNSTLVISIVLSAPILAIDVCGGLIACSLMDGGHAVVDTSQLHCATTGGKIDASNSIFSMDSDSPVNEGVATFKDHSKYAVSIRWSPDGSLLATASHDKSVTIYERDLPSTSSSLSPSSSTGAGALMLRKVHTFRFPVTPECVVFAPRHQTQPHPQPQASPTTEWELIVALRDTYYLCYIDCSKCTSGTHGSGSGSDSGSGSGSRSFTRREVSLNEAEWDTHVSFTPLYLALSPNMKYLLVATDKNMMFVVQVGHSKRLRLLAGGHSCGDYGKPKVSWDSTGKYVYCNSDEGNAVCVYSLASERPVANLRGHKGTVRDVVCHPDTMKRLLVTASYDKSVQLWSSKPSP